MRELKVSEITALETGAAIKSGKITAVSAAEQMLDAAEKGNEKIFDSDMIEIDVR